MLELSKCSLVLLQCVMREALYLLKKHIKETWLNQVCSCSMLPPVKQGSKMCKKGFCKANLTKKACFGQETLTGVGQETLTNQLLSLCLFIPRKLGVILYLA